MALKGLTILIELIKSSKINIFNFHCFDYFNKFNRKRDSFVTNLC